MPHVHRNAHLLGRHCQKSTRTYRPGRHRTLANRAPPRLQKRTWLENLQLYSDTKGGYTRAYVSAEEDDVPGLTVFTREADTIRHFWSGEMNGEMADPGQDPRGAPDLDPLWTILDLTPEGRGSAWYPKLEYASLTTIK
jgi:predicted dithiol-disulfide oxidoreductase (DUF899 family)